MISKGKCKNIILQLTNYIGWKSEEKTMKQAIKI